jgi:hypothetical protein
MQRSIIMQHTIAAVFNNPAEAQQACDALVSAGFPRDELHLSQEEAVDRSVEVLPDQDSDSDSPGTDLIRSFFTEVFGPARRADVELYSEAVRKGHYVLTVNVPEDELLDQVTDVLDQYHPLDIDEQASRWKSGGWSTPESMRQSGSTTAEPAPSQKFTVPAGGIGSAQVELPHDQSDSAASSMRQGSFSDMQLTPEGGNLRDKNISEERSRLSADDTRPGMPLDIEELPGTPDLFGAAAEADRERDDAYYKDHWDKNFADSGAKYEDYAPAYKHGALLAGSELNKGRAWDDVEHDIKSDWEGRNPDSTWEKIKAAVRHGWESMTNRV